MREKLRGDQMQKGVGHYTGKETHWVKNQGSKNIKCRCAGSDLKTTVTEE